MAITFNTARDMDVAFPSQGAKATGVFVTSAGVLQTTDLRASTTLNYFPNSPVVNDAIYFEVPVIVNGLTFNVGTARNGTVTLVWEYWTVGGTWTAFTPTSDGTNGFTTTGINTIIFPVSTMVNMQSGRLAAVSPLTASDAGYFVRCRISAISVTPTIGGAQTTNKIKYLDNTLYIDGYTSGAPASLSTLYSASVAGGWGVVTQIEANTYQTTANVVHGAAGYFADTDKTLIIGTSTQPRYWGSIAGCSIKFGTLRSGSPANCANNPCNIVHYNSISDYSRHNSDLLLYGVSYRSFNQQGLYPLSASTQFTDCNMTIAYGVLSGSPTHNRVTYIGLSANQLYTHTLPNAVYNDVSFQYVVLNVDPGYHPKFNATSFITSGNWRSGYTGASGSISYAAFDLINCTFTDVTVYSAPTTNQSYRTENFVAYTSDFSVYDTSNVAISGAVVSITNAYGPVMLTDSTTTMVNGTSGNLDDASWGNTSFTVVDGTKFAIGDVIQIDFEIMTVTNVAANVLTVTRAQQGTFIGKHNQSLSRSALPISKVIRSATTNASGAIPTQTICAKNYYWFGTSTPAPNNTGAKGVADYNPFTYKVRKYGYGFQSIVKALSAKDISSTTLAANPFTVKSESAASAITGITVSGSTSTITITATTTLHDLYDYTQWWAAQASNIQYAEPITTTDGSTYTSAYNIVLNGGDLTGGGSVTMATGTTFTKTSGAYDGIIINADGTRQVHLLLTGIVAGSRVQLYDTTASTELYNGMPGTTNDLVYTYSGSDHTVRIRVAQPGYLFVEATATAGSTGFNYTVAQTADDVYTTNAIDGSTVTEFSVTGSTIEAFINDPDNTTSIQRLYNWWCYMLSTSAGIADQGNYVRATDTTNYRMYTGLKLYNTKTNPLVLTGGYFVPSTGGTPIDCYDTAGGPIFMGYPHVVGFSYASGSALTTAEHNQLMAALTVGKFVALK